MTGGGVSGRWTLVAAGGNVGGGFRGLPLGEWGVEQTKLRPGERLFPF